MRKLIVFLLVLVFSTSSAFAATIAGKVFSGAADEPLVGVTLAVDGVDTAITDVSGAFALSADVGATLTAKKNGYVVLSALAGANDETLTFTLAPIWELTSATQVYTDLADTDWFAPFVKNLYEQQILSTSVLKPYRPADNLTRAELAVLVVRAAGLAEVISEISFQTNFCDVPNDAWFAPAVEFMRAQNWLGGYASSSCALGKEFRPNASVTRAEAVKMILNVFAKKVPLRLAAQTCMPASFFDVPSEAWFAPFVRDAACLGLVKGYADGTFGPGRTINRAEIAGILNQAIRVLR